MTGVRSPLKHWSHSTIKGLVDDCQHQWALKKIAGLPDPSGTAAARGVAYHGGVELHEQRRADWHYSGGRIGDRFGADMDEMIEACHRQLDALAAESDRIDMGEARAAVEAATRNWWEAVIPDGQPGAGGTLRQRVMAWQPIAVEREFRLWNDPDVTRLPTKGFPDVVYLDSTGDRPEVVVVDHKSATSHNRYPHDGEGLTPQKAMYLRALRRAPGLPGLSMWPARFEFHIARVTVGTKSNFQGVRVVSLPEQQWDGDILDGRYRMAEQALADGLANGFPKNPGWNLCSPKWCVFHRGAGGPCDPHDPAPAVEGM